jgi:hypothetical protein
VYAADSASSLPRGPLSLAQHEQLDATTVLKGWDRTIQTRKRREGINVVEKDHQRPVTLLKPGLGEVDACGEIDWLVDGTWDDILDGENDGMRAAMSTERQRAARANRFNDAVKPAPTISSPSRGDHLANGLECAALFRPPPLTLSESQHHQSGHPRSMSEGSRWYGQGL